VTVVVRRVVFFSGLLLPFSIDITTLFAYAITSAMHRVAHNHSHTAAMAESRLNLLVRYLDHAVDDAQLRRFFVQFGEVTSSMVMRDILTGESRGFGFVRFACHNDAARAMAEADGKKIGGKAVNVLWAKQQHDMAPAGQDRLKMNKLFLRNVPMDVTEEQLAALVSVYGTVAEVSLHNDKISAACHAPSRRIAFIVFTTEGAAEAALHAVHNTCPFRSCYDVPLMAKLSEDYKAKSSTPTRNVTVPPQRCSPVAMVDTAPAAPAPVPLHRASSAVITVQSTMKFAEQSSCHVSTPNSTAARSPGISSLVPSLESTSLEVAATPMGAPRQMTAMESDGSTHSPQPCLRTPVRHLSADARVYRHNPYGATQMVPAMVTSSVTSVFADSPVSQPVLRRG
jgi:hypothetical protein